MKRKKGGIKTDDSDCRMRLIPATINSPPLHIIDIKILAVQAADQDFHFDLIEHPEPFQLDDIVETLEECGTLALELHVQLVVGHQVDIVDPVLSRHRCLGAIGNQLDRL